jgi:deazaflavin-dependent oxidoreductase (nitroreductase family)
MKVNPVVERAIRGASRFHASLYRLFGGRGVLGRRTLVLTTRGRKTGRPVSIPLFYVAEAERLYVVASFGGNDQPPHWYVNLTAHPEVTVEIGTTTGRYTAQSLTAAQAAPIWPKLLAMYPTYDAYKKRTSREIPVVELTPITGS